MITMDCLPKQLAAKAFTLFSEIKQTLELIFEGIELNPGIKFILTLIRVFVSLFGLIKALAEIIRELRGE